jgi:hypothetical protein
MNSLPSVPSQFIDTPPPWIATPPADEPPPWPHKIKRGACYVRGNHLYVNEADEELWTDEQSSLMKEEERRDGIIHYVAMEGWFMSDRKIALNF